MSVERRLVAAMNISGLVTLLAAVIAAAQAPAAASKAAQWRSQASPVAVELRGLAVVGDRVAWAAVGQKGAEAPCP